MGWLDDAIKEIRAVLNKNKPTPLKTLNIFIAESNKAKAGKMTAKKKDGSSSKSEKTLSKQKNAYERAKSQSLDRRYKKKKKSRKVKNHQPTLPGKFKYPSKRHDYREDSSTSA